MFTHQKSTFSLKPPFSLPLNTVRSFSLVTLNLIHAQVRSGLSPFAGRPLTARITGPSRSSRRLSAGLAPCAGFGCLRWPFGWVIAVFWALALWAWLRCRRAQLWACQSLALSYSCSCSSSPIFQGALSIPCAPLPLLQPYHGLEVSLTPFSLWQAGCPFPSWPSGRPSSSC